MRTAVRGQRASAPRGGQRQQQAGGGAAEPRGRMAARAPPLALRRAPAAEVSSAQQYNAPCYQAFTAHSCCPARSPPALRALPISADNRRVVKGQTSPIKGRKPRVQHTKHTVKAKRVATEGSRGVGVEHEEKRKAAYYCPITCVIVVASRHTRSASGRALNGAIRQ